MSPPKKRQHKLGHLSEAEKHSYEDKGTSELVVEVARMLGLAKSTIYRILAEYKAKGKVGASGRPSITESFDESIKTDIRKVVHGFFFKNELDKILCEIKQWPTIPNMSRSTLYKVMRHINFRNLKRNRKSLLIEREEIVI
ncbi:hypothetical protein NQ315_010868 [Exocentrus adspersus]|uniref:Transposase n=1 Tax=Exocentrus adspersus TaxID=1586481 RepID=A0AAV8VBS6_9CUCU|nr:hypothetical protein NQ315_010868 [Exocentrus adspersus]